MRLLTLQSRQASPPATAGMHRRLALLSASATRAGRRQALWLPVAGALMFCFLAALLYAMWWLYQAAAIWFGSPAVLGGGSDVITYIFPAILLWNVITTLPRCIWLVARGASLFDQQYARAWRQLETTNFAVLLADETYWEVLQRNLALPLQRRVGSELGKRLLERQLETAAAFRLAFEDLQRGLGYLRRGSLLRGTRALGVVQSSRYTLLLMLLPMVFIAIPIWVSAGSSRSWTIALLMLALPFAVTLMIYVSLATHNGPLLAQHRATLAALCDHLLLDRDEADALLAQLPTPLPQPRWLQLLEERWLALEERLLRLGNGPPQ